jgi:enoyl-CoA hydratase/carnithine racemase
MTATPPRADAVTGAVRLDLTGDPPRGFLSEPLVERLLSNFTGSAQVAAVVMEGTNGTFCMGLDPTVLLADGGTTPASDRSRSALERFGRLLDAVERAARPVIALVDGTAAGGGVALAAAADVVIASRRATFGLPETLLGVVPALAFPVLARRIGTSRARWMALSGATVDAMEAGRLGIADIVVDDLEAALDRCLRRLRRLDARSIAAVKRLAALHATESATYASAALQTFGELVDSPETQARLRRFAAGLAPWPEDEER